MMNMEMKENGERERIREEIEQGNKNSDDVDDIIIRWRVQEGSQSIEELQVDIVLLRMLIRKELRSRKVTELSIRSLNTSMEIQSIKLQSLIGILQVCGCHCAAGGIWAYSWNMQRTNVHLLAFNLTRGIPLTPREKKSMLDILTQPAPWWLFLVLF
ncbi:hypothetical protein Hanom_Chr15g01410211 [Helianthus anomalus]